MKAGRTFVLAALLAAAAPLPARAQDTGAQQRAAAEALFEDATRLMGSGRTGEACPRLAEVVRLQPMGIGAKLKLAECYETAGQLASAFAAYGFAARAAAAASDPRAADATSRAAALKPRLSTLTIVTPSSAPPDLRVRRNGAEIGRGQWGTAVPVDGGAQVIESSAQGHLTQVTSTTVPSEGGVVSVTLPALSLAPADDAAGGPTLPSGGSPGDERGDGGIPVWVWISGGAGLVLSATAVGFAVDQASAASAIEDACGPGRDACVASYDLESDRSREQRDFAFFIGFGAAGAVALGVATVGLISSAVSGPDASARGPRLTAWATPSDGYLGLVQPLP